ncbi:MAG: histidine phosphatase family protein [Bacteroidales bacterium]|nr:histidine phosphatase family protein [Bacteroidales bacterium]MDP2236738.1 histidine phosphatase family protein [Bacteroidales bacterium]
MKLLYIIRHAKSSWDYPELSDHERPLIEKGRKRTRKVIEYLKKQAARPDFIISSSALRARETADLIAEGLGIDKDLVKTDPSLYHTDANQIFTQFADLSDRFQEVMIVGHNPAFTNFSNLFLVPPIDWLPTSAVVCLEFETDKWEEIEHAEFKVKFVIFPKLIGEV